MNENPRQKSFDLKRTFELSLMALPGAMILFVFNYLPMAGILITFKDYTARNGFFGSPWVGFKNFDFFFASQDAWRITRNTLGYNATFILLGLVVSIAFALMLNEIRSRSALKYYQTAFFFPYFLSWVVAGYALYAFLDTDQGVINDLLGRFGIEAKSWYTENGYWPPILILANLWKTVGYYSVIYYAGLMGIDRQLYEAAMIDGANTWQKIWRISLPMLAPLITLLVILQIGRIFYADFGLFYFLPRNIGLLYKTTDVIDTYVFRSLRVTGNIGMASAANFYQSVMGFLLVLLSNWIVKKTNAENAIF